MWFHTTALFNKSKKGQEDQSFFDFILILVMLYIMVGAVVVFLYFLLKQSKNAKRLHNINECKRKERHHLWVKSKHSCLEAIEPKVEESQV